MLESRWIRWVGTGGDRRRRAWPRSRRSTSGAGPRSWTPPPCAGPARPGTVAAAPAPTALADLGTQAWFRMDPQLDRTARCRASACRSASTAIARSGRSCCRPSHSRPVRSDGSSWSVAMTGPRHASRPSTSPPDARGNLPTEGCGHSTGDDRPRRADAVRDPGRSIDASRPRGLGARRWLGPRPHQVLEPLAADDRFGRTFTTEFCVGRRAAASWPCSHVANRRAAPGSSLRTDIRPGMSAEADWGP